MQLPAKNSLGQFQWTPALNRTGVRLGTIQQQKLEFEARQAYPFGTATRRALPNQPVGAIVRSSRDCSSQPLDRNRPFLEEPVQTAGASRTALPVGTVLRGT